MIFGIKPVRDDYAHGGWTFEAFNMPWKVYRLYHEAKDSWEYTIYFGWKYKIIDGVYQSSQNNRYDLEMFFDKGKEPVENVLSEIELEEILERILTEFVIYAQTAMTLSTNYDDRSVFFNVPVIDETVARNFYKDGGKYKQLGIG